MIHSARPIVTPVASIVFCCFVFLDFKSGDGRTDGLTCAKTMIPTGRDFGLAEWINNSTTIWGLLFEYNTIKYKSCEFSFAKWFLFCFCVVENLFSGGTDTMCENNYHLLAGAWWIHIHVWSKGVSRNIDPNCCRLIWNDKFDKSYPIQAYEIIETVIKFTSTNKNSNKCMCIVQVWNFEKEDGCLLLFFNWNFPSFWIQMILQWQLSRESYSKNLFSSFAFVSRWCKFIYKTKSIEKFWKVER